MQPWWHAKATARRRGADWRDDLPIHEFIDAAKIACPDLRHRIVLHNGDLGVALTCQAFPERPDCAEMARDHVRQDLGSIPSLADWMSTARRPFRVHWRAPRDDLVIADACEKLGLQDDAPVRRVLQILTAAAPFVQGHEDFGRAILMNNFGPWLVRRLMGPAREVTQPGQHMRVMDGAWVAEEIIVANFGRVPLLSEVLAPFSGQYPK